MPRHRKHNPGMHGHDDPGGSYAHGPKGRDRHPNAITLLPDSLLRFLNALPLTGDPMEWVRRFTDELTALFADVDRVAVRINLNCRLHTPPRRGAKSRATQSEIHVDAHPDPHILSWPPFDDAHYHEPMVFHFSHAGDDLGTITLLRERRKQLTSEETRSVMIGMETFLTFMLTDLVARHSSARPVGRVFQDVLHAIARKTGMTSRELEVLTLHVFGRKYDEIARRLYISIDTVKKHVKKIHRKTGARSATELFARYFAPMIEGDE